MATQLEQKLTLSEAARAVPPYPNGKHVNPSTIWRWIASGITVDGKTIKLESYPIGRRLFTTAPALERFSERLREARDEAYRNAKALRAKERAE